MTIINIAPSMLTYGMIVFIFYYFFAIIGMELFHGLIRFHGYNETYTELNNLTFCGNVKLKDSDFYKEHYCSNNFNHIFKSLVILVELTVVNQWHISPFSSILIAFIIEAFILEYSLSKRRKLETDIELTIKELGYKSGVPSKISKCKKSDKVKFAESDHPSDTREKAEDTDSDTDSIEDVSLHKGFRFHLKKTGSKSMWVILQQMFEEEIDDMTGRKSTLDSVM